MAKRPTYNELARLKKRIAKLKGVEHGLRENHSALWVKTKELGALNPCGMKSAITQNKIEDPPEYHYEIIGQAHCCFRLLLPSIRMGPK
jgi:hypothetical protein